MQKSAGRPFPVSLNTAMYKGKAYGVPQSVSPLPLVTRMDILEAAKVDPPKTWDEFVEVVLRSCKSRRSSPVMASAWGCTAIPKTM